MGGRGTVRGWCVGGGEGGVWDREGAAMTVDK